MDISEKLIQLSAMSGVSGHEFLYSDKIKEIFLNYCDKVHTDSIGNVIGIKLCATDAPLKLMIAAHMDEIGLMVKDIDDRGFVSFITIGGVDARILAAQEVIIHGKEKVFGVIGAKPPHLQSSEESSKAYNLADMSIDTGLSFEHLNQRINIGDIITFNTRPNLLQNNYVTGKSLDNRAGIAVLLECLKELENVNTNADIYAVATVQEEVGLRGAIVSSYNINPDIAIVIDVCHALTPDSSADGTFASGEGPVITIGPNINTKLAKKLIDTAKNYNIPYSIDVDPGNTGTDAWAIQVTRSGIPTLLVSIPLKYMHTNVETICYDDIEHAGKLLAFYIKALNRDLI
jgi:endoglucanase